MQQYIAYKQKEADVNALTTGAVEMRNSKINTPTIQDVEQFWNDNPLFAGEASLEKDNPQAFFAAHDETYFRDVLATISMQDVFVFPELTIKLLI